MKPRLWRPQYEDDQAFLERCRPLALPVASGLFFVAVALLLGACWSLAELFLA